MDRETIKAQARQLNKGNTFGLFLIKLVLMIITTGVSFISVFRTLFSIFQSQFYGYSGSGFNLFGSLSWIVTLVLIPVGVALTGYFVKFVRTHQSDAGEGIGYMFKNGFAHFGRYFGAAFTTGLIIFAWALIPFVGWVFSIVASYRYYFVPQIIHDNPELSASEAREISRKMTDGMKGELFVMELSFLGWMLLSSITFGLLFIYVMPYMETTKALYYENLRVRAIQMGLVHPQQFSTFQAVQTDVYGNPVSPMSEGYGQPQYGQPPVSNQMPVNPAPQQPVVNQVPVNPVPQQQPIANPAPQPEAEEPQKPDNGPASL